MKKDIGGNNTEYLKDYKDLQDLYKAILELKSLGEMDKFLTDLCTPTELLAMSDRWKAVQMLGQGIPYREIYEKTGVSTATITRVARCLSSGTGGYRLLIERLKKERKTYDI